MKSLKFKTSDLPDKPNGEYCLPALTAGIQNQGLNNYVPIEKNTTILENVISISANGANTGATFYQSKPFTVLQDAYAIKYKGSRKLTDSQYIFMTSCISQAIYGNYEWTNKAGWEKIKNEIIKLPKKNDNIDFDFMEYFVAQLEADHVAQLEAYLLATGFKDYNLTVQEQKALDSFKNIDWKEFNVKNLFGNASRGKRLKSSDRIQGKLPFVTAGENETGISDFIDNKVNIFSNNTITIDMFGSAKYRNYEYGADDHVSIVHTEDLLKYATIFITTAIHKSSYTGKFSYSRNFYPKDADELNIMLPVINNTPDYSIMNLLVSAVHKLVIKDVVEYSDKKIKLTQKIVN